MRLFFTFLFCGSLQLLCAQNLRITAQPLATVLTNLENDYDYLFSYREADIADVIITANLPTDKASELLNVLFAKTNLQYKIVENKYVIISQKDATEDNTPTIELPLLTGQIRDSLTGQPLSYANVFVKNTSTGTFTDLQGQFRLRYDLSAQDSLIISYVGYAEQAFKATDFSTSSSPTIFLNYLDLADNFVVVTDYLTDGVQLRNNNAYNSLQPAKIGSLPGQAEPDVLQTIQFLPGISSPDGTAAGINIRGGAADQNLLLWEGIPVYHAAHYFGMISAFNPYIIDEAQVYRGGFAANYGGRISGVINLKSNNYATTKNQFGVGLNFLNAYTYGKIKSANQKLTLRYSLRRSINDVWQSPTFNNITQRIQRGVLFDIPVFDRLPAGFDVNNNFRFLDGHFTINYQISPKSEIGVAALFNTNFFHSNINDSNLKTQQIDSLDLQNNGLRLRWQQQWLPHFTTEILAINSDYSYNYEYEYLSRDREDRRDGTKSNRICEKQLQVNNTYTAPEQWQVRAGYHLQHYTVESLINNRKSDSSPDYRQFDNSFFAHSIYTDISTAPQQKWGAELGLRWNYLQINPKANQRNLNNFFEPRLRLWYQPLEQLQLYGNAGKYFQFLNQIIEIEGDEASIEMPIWVLGGEDEELPFLNATQYQVGAVWQRNTLLIDVQLYYKNIGGLTSLASNFDEFITSRFYLGEANIRGLDVLIKKRWGRFRSWVSYSYSDIEHRFPAFFDPVFPASTEQPHQLHWVNTYTIGGFDCSLGWKLASGTPYSDRRNFRLVRRTGMNQENNLNQLQPIVQEFNSARLPLQHQLDISVNYTYQTERWKAIFGLSIFNVYDQQNIYSRSFFISRRSPHQHPNNRLELRYLDRANLGFTPNAVVRLEW